LIGNLELFGLVIALSTLVSSIHNLNRTIAPNKESDRRTD